MKPSLPQNDTDPTKRKSLLERNQGEYEFDHEFLAPMAMLKDVPSSENFSTKYIAERTIETAELPINMLAVNTRSLWDPLDELQDYEDYFPVLPRPNVIKTYQTDDSFCEQRLCGVNPLVLRRIQEMPPGFAFTISELQEKFGNSIDLVEKLANGNLYVADYRALAFVKGGNYERGKKYLPTPIAFFCWRSSGFSDRGQLVPIAIQINPTDGRQSQLITPFDSPLTWFHAKLCVQIADANHHEMSSHLCRTHFVMEPFAIVTARQLAENHPLNLLLKPHFRFMLANNDLARKRLVNRGGPVDELLAGTLQESLKIVVNAYEEWSLDQFSLPTELKNRGVDDPNKLPHYPYRDDGLLLWNAIKKFVSEYLKLYYKTPQDLTADFELQAWAQELVSQSGGRVKGVPNSIETLDQLVDIGTAVIFTCGPQHAAVNYPQYEYMTFMPNMPLAAYKQMTAEGTIADRKSLLSCLPPPKQTADQLSILFILSAYRYDRLGYYDNKFVDPEAQDILVTFQQELNEVERKIELNNKSRLINYNYLKPRLVTNSISI
ncbi:lipoxygenase family protein [Nostoc sp. FACHB-888]|uniref:lipoxygenase family protein n=1 Tax=Nostoc sp. FACHB-888 TaxID=2692842 RepID=UPI001685CC5D|nr:lipoxygenase family protein [Nostoc sp. FACHB-888]MBD2243268.1 lipoxygenase [Nostoc sp. FACHB-888]